MKKVGIYLVIIYIISLVFRMYLSMQVPHLSYDSYFAVRQLENIAETGAPLYHDNLSFGGRNYAFSPLYYYILTIPYYFFPSELTIKLFSNIFASLIVFVVYLIAKNITKDTLSALLTSFLSAFIPIYVGETVASTTPFSLAIPLMFLASLYFFDPKKSSQNVILALLLPLIHPIFLILICAFIFYYFLAKTEKVSLPKGYEELLFFYSLVGIWITLFLYKSAFLMHGSRIFLQNLPTLLTNEYFTQISLLDAFSSIGVVTLIVGSLACYKCLYVKEDKSVYFLISLGIISIISVLLKLIPVKSGLIILGIVLTILSASVFKMLIEYLKDTRIARFSTLILTTFVFIFFISLLFPSIILATQNDTPSENELEAFNFLKENVGKESVILAPPKYGNLITYISEKPNVLDNNYLMIPLSSTIYEDYQEIYSTSSDVKSISLLSKYHVDYVLLPEKTELTSYKESCYEEVFNNGVRILNVKCRARVT